jgi:hypothetical protein
MSRLVQAGPSVHVLMQHLLVRSQVGCCGTRVREMFLVNRVSENDTLADAIVVLKL